MCSNDQCTPEHEAFTNHIMACRVCHAPTHNHCADGWRLKLETDARFIANLGDIADRRRWMARMWLEIPDRMAELEELVRAKYAERAK